MDTKLRLLHLLALPGGLCFHRPSYTKSAKQIMEDIAFQLHILLGLGDQTGNEVIDVLDALEAEDRLGVLHDNAEDKTTLMLKLNPSDQELGEQAAGDLERMADLMGRIASSAEGPEPKLLEIRTPAPITMLIMGTGAAHIDLATSTPAGIELLKQLHAIAAGVRT